jgi:hypothetical protein
MKTLAVVGLIAAFLGFWAMQAKKPVALAPSIPAESSHR